MATQYTKRPNTLLLIADSLHTLDLRPFKQLRWMEETRAKLGLGSQRSQQLHQQQDILISGQQLGFVERESRKLLKAHIKVFSKRGEFVREWSSSKIKEKYKQMLTISRQLHENHGQDTIKRSNSEKPRPKSTATKKQLTEEQDKVVLDRILSSRDRKYLEEFKISRFYDGVERSNRNMQTKNPKLFGKLVPKLQFHMRRHNFKF